MISGLLQQEASIVRRTGTTTDAHGNTVTTDADPFSAMGAAQQNTESERRDGQDQGTSEWWVFLDADVALSRLDQITIAGQTFEVDGRPRQVRRETTGEVHHIEVPCRLVEG